VQQTVLLVTDPGGYPAALVVLLLTWALTVSTWLGLVLWYMWRQAPTSPRLVNPPPVVGTWPPPWPAPVAAMAVA
jgi:hypothetical protein